MRTQFVRVPSANIKMNVFQALSSSSAQPNIAMIKSQPDVVVAEMSDDDASRIAAVGGLIYAALVA